MMGDSFRDTWAEVSLGAIRENLGKFRDFIDKTVKIMAVVKADGYGHGAVATANAAISAGADYLAVATLDEAIELRDAGINMPILILGFTPARSVREAIKNDITLTVFTREILEYIILHAKSLGKQAAIHIKIDTGMTRIGIASAIDAVEIATMADAADVINLEGIFTHFALAGSSDSSYTAMQFARFLSTLEEIEKAGINIPLKHCCNSAATMSYPDMHLDMVRVGIAMYGLYPDTSLKSHPIKLREAMELKTRIAAIKSVPPFQPAGYGCTWVSPIESIIATLPIGYADGLSRMLSNRGSVLIHGQAAPVAGRVCMDQTLINVTGIEGCKLGDIATVFGEDYHTFQSIDDIADLMGTINYEVVCLIGKRVPRVYKQPSPEKIAALAQGRHEF